MRLLKEAERFKLPSFPRLIISLIETWKEKEAQHKMLTREKSFLMFRWWSMQPEATHTCTESMQKVILILFEMPP